MTTAEGVTGAGGHGGRTVQQWLVPATRDVQSPWTVGVRAARERCTENRK